MDACILELTTRSFALFHARVAEGGRLTPMHSCREPVGIEASIEDTGTIGGEAWRPALRVLDRVVSNARMRSRSGYIAAVAPHALGGATDAVAFAAAAARRTGICPLLLSYRDTARLLYSGARAEAPDLPGYVTVIELGETALDFVSGRGDRCEVVDQALLGVAHLHRAFGASESGFLPVDAPALFSLVRLSAGPAVRRIRDLGHPSLILTSELALAVLSAARSSGYADDAATSLDRVAFHAFVAEILTAKPSILEEMGVEPRASALVATAGIIIDSLADLLGQREIRFGSWGVPQGAALAALSPPRIGRRLAG